MQSSRRTQSSQRENFRPFSLCPLRPLRPLRYYRSVLFARGEDLAGNLFTLAKPNHPFTMNAVSECVMF